jgi:hypothetical protein
VLQSRDGDQGVEQRVLRCFFCTSASGIARHSIEFKVAKVSSIALTLMCLESLISVAVWHARC